MLKINDYTLPLKEKMYKEIMDDLIQKYILMLSKFLNYATIKIEDNNQKLKNIIVLLYPSSEIIKDNLIKVYDILNIPYDLNESIIIEFINNYNYIEKMYQKTDLNISQDIQYLVHKEKYELACKIIKEFYYKKIFQNLLDNKKIIYEKYEECDLLIEKILIAYQNKYDKQLNNIYNCSYSLEGINSLLFLKDSFNGKENVILSLEEFKTYIDEWCWDICFNNFTYKFIDLFYEALNQKHTNVDYSNNKELFFTLLNIIKSNNYISKEIVESIESKMQYLSSHNDETNEKICYELLDIYTNLEKGYLN